MFYVYAESGSGCSETKKMNNGPLTVLKQYEQQTLERLQYQYLQIDAWLINLDHRK